MKITKTFEMGISGKYQTYRFGSSMELSVSEATAGGRLSETVIEQTLQDIERFAQGDEEFQLVLQARKDDLERYRKFLEKQNAE